ncbi:hypothetical protein ACQEVG_04585 [Streptomyces sp. CA-135486]|uniref:hypothetical protein n=1 Tax=Streptomyces sp. CA-135486 TaxID=3240049 RepID=UPI003D8D7AA1
MRAVLIALRAAGAAAVLVLAPTATGAYADESVRATVAPAVPGGEVEIHVQGCRGTTGAVMSQAFVADAELSGRQGSELFAETTVKSNAGPGTYDVSVTCDGRDHAASGRAQVVRNLPTKAPAHEPTDLRTPVAPVRAGGGGAAALAAHDAHGARGAADPAEAGPGTGHAVMGLVLAGVAALAVGFRSSRLRRTDTD